ncbi:unnamed protein product [Brugia timori]|uniref:Uncharacterized protein n=1 Tax=Brugia timori TaxID=42155 RepID=A0A0R3QDL4_9BILA|nr:unnamed protein product [Brugia timori]
MLKLKEMNKAKAAAALYPTNYYCYLFVDRNVWVKANLSWRTYIQLTGNNIRSDRHSHILQQTLGSADTPHIHTHTHTHIRTYIYLVLFNSSFPNVSYNFISAYLYSSLFQYPLFLFQFLRSFCLLTHSNQLTNQLINQAKPINQYQPNQPKPINQLTN